MATARAARGAGAPRLAADACRRRRPPPLQVEEVLAEATPDHDAVLVAAAELAAAVDVALAKAGNAAADPSAVAGLAAALGVPVPGRLRWEPPTG